MGNGSSKRGDALSDHRRDEWAQRKADIEDARRHRERRAAEREAALERERARGTLESLSDVDFDEISNKLVDAALEGVKAGRDMRSKRVESAHDTPVPPSWHKRQAPLLKVGGAILALLSAIGAVVQALREAGVFGP